MNINNIHLRHLRYFLAVAEELNFTRAAERLHMAQPPLSHQIQQLEANLNARLFHRTRRKVALTEAGLYLRDAANRLMREIEDALLHAQAAARGHIGELRVGINFSAPLHPRFPRLIARCRNQYPHMRLIFKEVFYTDGIEALYSGDIDACFTRFSSSGEKGKISFHLFAEDRVDLCLPQHHPKARSKTVRMGDLKDDLFLLSPRQARTPLFDALQKMADKAGFMMRLSQDTAHFPIMINLVAAGYGIGFMPSFMKTMTHSDVVFKKLEGLKPDMCDQPLMIAARREDENQLLKNFLALTKE